MDRRDSLETDGVDSREASRVRRRERRRRTPMVVDNAGVKRIQQALRERARRRAQAVAPAEGQRKP